VEEEGIERRDLADSGRGVGNPVAFKTAEENLHG